MMRVSATTLESFRLYVEQDWMTEASLIESIRGEFVPTPKVLLGSAFGRVIEVPDACRVDGGYRSGDYFFTNDVIEPALAVFDRRGVFEAKGTRQYGDALVVAKADQLFGSRLVENKTTLSSFDFDKYAASYQWRFMADIFQPSQITYHVFCLSESAAGHVGLKSIETFNFFPYEALHRDCERLLARFVEYVMARGLDGMLRERQRIAEAA